MIGGIAMLRTPWVVLKLRFLNFIAGPKPHYSLGGPVGWVSVSGFLEITSGLLGF